MCHQSGVEAVETRRYGGMRGKQVAGAGGRQRAVEICAGACHVVAGSFEHHQGRVAFVEMTDLRCKSEGVEQAPAADTQDHFLHEPQFGAAAVQFAGNPSIGWMVRRVIGVQEIELQTPDSRLPGAQPNRVSG